jgi:hypothetical protein
MEINKNKLIAFVFAVSFVGVSYADSEVLYGVTMTPEGLEFQVASAGCTDKSDFIINVTKGIAKTPTYNVTLNRIKSDTCKKLVPEGVSIKYTKMELGINNAAELILTNKIGNTSKRMSLLESSFGGKKDDFSKKPISTLLNKSLRVLKKGGFYTGDYKLNRVNIEVDESGNIIGLHEG